MKYPELSPSQVRAFRLRAHHLDQPLPASRLEEAAGACGLQNSPPGAWENALFCRMEQPDLARWRQALEEDRTLLQAWSFRGVPLVFPTRDSGIFLSALTAQPGEDPWIYTRGITAALEAVGIGFDPLLEMVAQAAACLDGQTIQSKEQLDRVLAAQVEEALPPALRERWRGPSMYGSPDRQTVGQAAVSFLLRPCSFLGLVVFGKRQGIHPTFTSPTRWLGAPLAPSPDGPHQLVRRYLHCYGPSTRADFAAWLGCSPQQGRRLWQAVDGALCPVSLLGRTVYLLAEDLPELLASQEGDRLLLLGAHDPYLDLRDRALILPHLPHQRKLWKITGNPGAILRGGQVIGCWSSRMKGGSPQVSLELWEVLSPAEEAELSRQVDAWSAFRRQQLSSPAAQ